jgi:hypothetical protein
MAISDRFARAALLGAVAGEIGMMRKVSMACRSWAEYSSVPAD